MQLLMSMIVYCSCFVGSRIKDNTEGAAADLFACNRIQKMSYATTHQSCAHIQLVTTYRSRIEDNSFSKKEGLNHIGLDLGSLAISG